MLFSSRSRDILRPSVSGALEYAIFTTEEKGRVVDWPPGCEQAIFGRVLDEMPGRPLPLSWAPEDWAAGVPEASFHVRRNRSRPHRISRLVHVPKPHEVTVLDCGVL
ncbi:hypothetical protein RHECIAT_PB0000067 (plasmid) [Rhizobium etli CIAT 652]|uniref:Uncharacterized protein n=1 Tax=Rhizobium etli (strain CIAT 652) TaxID=491916 RepID=B3Q279_RHIE6|nr:hypothetical protein RHECIAT_PB0000067 [Rhizobium etli CIAT 652]